MIPRYSRNEMARIWTPESKFSIWLRIETYAAEAMAKFGTIPKKAA
ncbi:MAG TPA: adenylosuccinate lyase, partial [Methyloceanibacter sp.]